MVRAHADRQDLTREDEEVKQKEKEGERAREKRGEKILGGGERKKYVL
jgi:hypothetical protein